MDKESITQVFSSSTNELIFQEYNNCQNNSENLESDRNTENHSPKIQSPVGTTENSISNEVNDSVSSHQSSSAKITTPRDIIIKGINDLITENKLQQSTTESKIPLMHNCKRNNGPKVSRKNENFFSKNPRSAVIKYKIRGSVSKSSFSNANINLIAKHINTMKKDDSSLLKKIFNMKPNEYPKGQGDSLLVAKGSALEKLGISPRFKISQTSYSISDLHKALMENNLKLKQKLDEKITEYNTMLPRFKFLEENYEEFLLLKADFMKIKGSKIAKGEYTEKKDESTQTWSTAVMCDYCVDTRSKYEDPAFQKLAHAIFNSNDYYIVARDNLDGLKASFSALKDKIHEREKDYEQSSSDFQYLEMKQSNYEKTCKIEELKKKCDRSIKVLTVLQKILLKIPEEMQANLSEKERIWLKKLIRKIKAKYPIIEDDISCITESLID